MHPVSHGGATKITLLCGLLWNVVVYRYVAEAQNVRESDSSCTQIDFDEATVTSLRKCGYMQDFTAKPYRESSRFEPYRPGAQHYLSNQWEGLTCGETVRTYSFNTDTELRMAYNLVFDSGATMEVRVYDLDRIDKAGNPVLVESWRRMSSTDGWGFFQERLNNTVKQALIQIQANMNAGSDMAIEYLTIFNYEVETDECGAIDEFQTTVTSTDPSTTTLPATTSTTTTTTATTTTTTPTTTASTTPTPDTEEITQSTTDVSEEQPTTTSEKTTASTTTTTSTTTTSTTAATTTTEEATTTTTTTSTEATTAPSTTTTVATTPTTTTETTTKPTTPSTTASSTQETTRVTTTTNAPRDDTSILPTSSSTVEQTFTTVQEGASTATSTASAAIRPDVVNLRLWLWKTLAGLFATMFFLVASGVFYLWLVNQHLDRAIASLLEELTYDKH